MSWAGAASGELGGGDAASCGMLLPLPVPLVGGREPMCGCVCVCMCPGVDSTHGHGHGHGHSVCGGSCMHGRASVTLRPAGSTAQCSAFGLPRPPRLPYLPRLHHLHFVKYE